MSLPPRSFLPMGIGEQHWGCLALVTFYLADALPWRRLIWATLLLGDASPWRCLRLVSPHVDFDLDADFDLDFVNARVRDGTQAPQS